MAFSGKIWRFLCVAVVLIVVFIFLGAASIATWEYTNSNAFCADACHNVHPEEAYAHQASQHAQVKCVECHMGRLSTFQLIATKATHISRLWGMLTGYDRPLTADLPASHDACQGCHPMQPHQNDSTRVSTYYESDQTNTEMQTLLSLRTAGGAARRAEGQGIRWHTKHQIRFIATDAQHLNIPWVEVTQPDGRTVTYRDVQQGRLEGESLVPERRVMECTDCHNRVGHPFQSPEAVVDEALAEERLNRRLPYIKKRLVALLKQDFATQEDALRLGEEAWAQYLREFPNIPKDYPEDVAKAKAFLIERQRFMSQLFIRSKFLEPGISWQSFYDHMGHKNFPGCFRCHSGKHMNAAGEPISANCALCHQIPVVARQDKTANGLLPPFGLPEPDNHRASTFLHEHRTLFMEDESCQVCHGAISFGDDNKSFCSNFACHGVRWTNLSLDTK